jgi:hypothetical protein
MVSYLEIINKLVEFESHLEFGLQNEKSFNFSLTKFKPNRNGIDRQNRTERRISNEIRRTGLGNKTSKEKVER